VTLLLFAVVLECIVFCFYSEQCKKKEKSGPC